MTIHWPYSDTTRPCITTLTIHLANVPDVTCPFLFHQTGGEDNWCPIQCTVTVPRPDLCTNTYTLETFDTTKTIWLYLLVRILNGITLGKNAV